MGWEIPETKAEQFADRIPLLKNEGKIFQDALKALQGVTLRSQNSASLSVWGNTFL